MSVTQINAQDAFNLLKQNKNSTLVDVRTIEEFDLDGIANATEFEDRMLLLPWKTLPEMKENPEFGNILENFLNKTFAQNSKDAHIIFMCLIGGRSNQAANYVSNLGYKNCYNLISGFEGDLNKEGKRGTINGWKADNLPWRKK